MSDSPLARHAGPVALVAGTTFAVVDLGRLVVGTTADPVARMADPAFRVFDAAYFGAFVGLAIALIAVRMRPEQRTGRFGVIAFLARWSAS